jgi:polyisoprenoid-binding protein YceI
MRWDFSGENALSLGMTARLAAVLALSIMAAAPALAENRTYRLDPDHMSISFLVSHVGFAKILGVFHTASGEIVFDEEAPALTSGTITVETGSVDTRHEARDEHLRSDDFFDSETYPEMVFTLTGSEALGERTGTITGNLLLRGQTHPITLDVTWNKSGEYPFGDRHYAVGISARGTLDRSLWGMDYGVADGLVGDEVELIIEAEFIRE